MNRIRTIALILTVVSAAGAGAQVCDLTELDNLVTAGALAQPAQLGSTLYVAGGTAGIVRIDAGDSSALVLLDSHPTDGEAVDVTLDFATNQLVVADGSEGVATYLVSGEAEPTAQARVALGESAISIAGFSNRFLVGSQEGTLFVVNVSASGVEVAGSVAVGGEVLGIVRHSQRAYCALGNGGLAVVDVSQSTSPFIIDTLDLGGPVLSVAGGDDALYCGVDGVGLVTARFDGAELHMAGSLALSAPPTRLVLWAGRLYMAGPELGVAEADISLGTDVLVLGTLALDGASGLALEGRTLWVGRGVNGLSSIDTTECSTEGLSPTTSYIPAGARATGLENTYWVTDVAVANLTGEVATFNVAYLIKNQANSSPNNLSLVLGIGEQLLLADIFGTLFDLEEANGALRMVTSHPDVKLSSRTYNAAGIEGTYGQFIPALSASDATVPGVAAVLPQLTENDDFRTNIGLLNLDNVAVDVRIDLYSANGDFLGSRSETLLPFEMTQLSRIYDLIGVAPVDSGYAVVSAESGDRGVLAYASVIDFGSGDPVYIPAQRLSPAAPFPMP